MKGKILIVEDQFVEANNLKHILSEAGYAVCRIARSVRQAIKIIEEEEPSLSLLDILLDGDQTGIDLARLMNNQGRAFVFLSANTDCQTFEAAKNTNPYGFLVKPFRRKDVLFTVEVACQLHRQGNQVMHTKIPLTVSPAPQQGSLNRPMLGESKAMQEVAQKISIVAPSMASVLLLGESGTGKELTAMAIHQRSARAARPFITINCGALPATLVESELFGHEKGAFTNAISRRTGCFEQAQGGTLFLDEIGELPPDIQVKLLRALQEREVQPIGGEKRKVDVRFIAATNRDLARDVASGRFRADLFYRLNVFPITLPPLRDRVEDILMLARHFINVYAAAEGKTITGMCDAVSQAILKYSWPGNVRELENIIARSVLISCGPIIETIDLPQPFPAATQVPEATLSMVEHEKQHILSVLRSCGWKIGGTDGASILLGLHPSTLRSRMKKLGIEKQGWR